MTPMSPARRQIGERLEHHFRAPPVLLHARSDTLTFSAEGDQKGNSQARGIMVLRPLSCAGFALVSLTTAFPAEAQWLFAPAPDLRSLPPPPKHFTHHVLATPEVDPERPPLRLNVRPRRLPAARPPEGRKAPPIDRVVNPLPLLLADDTLRYGDVVMFPDGPRVFTGSPGQSHSVSDFEKLVATGKKAARSVREALVRLKAGVNDAWREVAVGRDGKIKDAPATNPYVEQVKGALDEEFRAARRRIEVRTGNGL